MKRNYLFFSCILISTMILTACAPQQENTNNVKDRQSLVKAEKESERKELETLPSDQARNEREIINVSSAMAVELNTLDELINQTTLGIEGRVIDEEPYVQIQEGSPDTPYTKLSVQITKVLTGDKELQGTTITILEAGGEITKEALGFKEKFPELTEEELKKEVLVEMDGIPNTKIGETIIGFLTADMGTMNTDFSFYSFMGEYQARFKKNEESDTYERELPKEELTEESKSRTIEENQKNTELNQAVTALAKSAE